MSGRPCVLFLVSSLAAGGAERQLCELVSHMDCSRFEVHVLVFYEPGRGNRGELWPIVAALPGVGLHTLRKPHGPLGYLPALPRALRLVRRLRPDVLHGYAEANLLALLLGTLFRRPVVWGIRRASRDLSKLSPLGLRLLKVSVRLSRRVDLVLFNSRAGMAQHQEMGMAAPRMQVVTNGFDTERFRPDPAGGAAQRRTWGLPEEVPLIGIVGRLDPVKDHGTFLRAAARLAVRWPSVRFVCVGGGPDSYKASLQGLADSLGLADRVLWPGVCTEMTAVYSALTVLVLSSTDEGFPNVVGEAMACGVPCVSTEVGDAAILVGDTGRVVGIGDDAAIAEAVSDLLGEGNGARAVRAEAARSRICGNFSVEILARNTERALLDVMDHPGKTLPAVGTS